MIKFVFFLPNPQPVILVFSEQVQTIQTMPHVVIYREPGA